MTPRNHFHAWLAHAVAAVVFLLSSRASAEKPRASDVEDAVTEGDVDFEDLAVGARANRGILRSAPGGQTWVSLTGFARETLGAQREVGGFVVVGLALDRIARQSQRHALADPKPPPVLPPPQTDPESRPPPPRPPGPAPFILSARDARTCVSAAWHAAGLGPDDARLDAIVSRARWSALLPETRLRALRWDDERLSADLSSTTDRLYDSAGAKLGFEARLTWRLDRLLYSDDEPTFERIRLERQDARARVASHVLDALFRWQRARLELRTPEEKEKGAIDDPVSLVRVAEAEAMLDVLTAGWFTTWRTFATTKGGP